MGINYDQVKENYGEDTNAINLSLKNNAQLCIMVFEMLRLKRNLMSLFRYTKDPKNATVEALQNQNSLYSQLWLIFGNVVDLSEPHLLDKKTKTTEYDRKLIQEARNILDTKEYGSYDLKKFCVLVQKYYDVLCRHGFFEITIRYLSQGGIHGFVTG